MNSPFKDTVINNNKRTLHFEPETSHPKIWTESDFELLVQSGNFFARKFDHEVDDTIIEKLEAHLQK